VHEAPSQLRIRSGRWTFSARRALAAFVLLLPVLLAGASLSVPRSYALTAFGDLSQFFLLATATIFFVRKAVSTRATHRAFWLLLALGFAAWSTNMFLWTYYEVLRNVPVPSIPIGDFLLFIKLVPMIAALALEPNHETPGRPPVLGLLDIASLLVYWTYIFLFWAMAYRFSGNDLGRYDRNSDIVGDFGNLFFLVILAVVAMRSRGSWRSFYLHFLGASMVYTVTATLLNNAIFSDRYYTGSIYDLPLTTALAWLCFTAITTPVDSRSSHIEASQQPQPAERSMRRPVLWVARLSMLATLSTPVIGLWLVMSGNSQDPVRHFRILLTLFIMLLVAILLLVKQDLLNFKLAGNLRDASRAYLDLKKFQHQLVQNEKLASLGKLVAQVAHEINKAMIVVHEDIAALGPPPADINRQKMITKIEESALRTNNLVESMLSFAQELPVNRSPVNVRPLVERAVSLARTERRHNVQVEIHQEAALPRVEGDANQLVQVFLHIIANAIDSMEESHAGSLRIALRARQESVEIEFCDTGPGLKDPRRVFEPFYTTKPIGKGVGLGLSTCYGIIRQHGGEIDCWNRREGGAVFKLVVPAAAAEAVDSVTQISCNYWRPRIASND